MIRLTVNGIAHSIDVPPETPLLWVLRDGLGLVGTKFGCGAALCGSCTVHLDDDAVRSCVLPAEAVGERRITTIEGLSGPVAKAVTDAWIANSVPQCGYCQPGFVMAAVAAIRATPAPTLPVILEQLTNICRCGSYDAVRIAIAAALVTIRAASP